MDDDRRRFLGKVTGVVGAAIGGAVAVPAVGYLADPLSNDAIDVSQGITRVGPVSRFQVGQPVKVPILANRRDAWQTTRDVTVGSVWVVRTAEEAAAESFRVLSTICPHLGCAVAQADDGFHCPCHRSRFAGDGARVEDGAHANPSPRDMDRLEHEVRDGVLFVRYERFQVGTADKVPA